MTGVRIKTARYICAPWDKKWPILFFLWLSKIQLFRQMLGIYYSVPWAYRDVIIAGKFQIFPSKTIFTDLIYHAQRPPPSVGKMYWLSTSWLVDVKGTWLVSGLASASCGLVSERSLPHSAWGAVRKFCMRSFALSLSWGRRLDDWWFWFSYVWIGGVVGQGLVIIGHITHSFRIYVSHGMEEDMGFRFGCTYCYLLRIAWYVFLFLLSFKNWYRFYKPHEDLTKDCTTMF